MTQEEAEALAGSVARAADAVEVALRDGVASAMSRFNGQVKNGVRQLFPKKVV